MRSSLRRTLRAAHEQLWGVIEWLVSFMPGPLGMRLRSAYWKRRLRAIGQHVRFGLGVRIYGPQWVQIGDECWIDDYVIILAGPIMEDGRFVYHKPNPKFTAKTGEVIIGHQVHIAPYVQLQGHGGLLIGDCLTIAAGAKVYSLSHHYRDLTGQGNAETIWKFGGSISPQEQALISGPVVIQDGAAVGLNSVVLPGSVIGENSWLGAMSVLRGELPPGVIAVGNPATTVKDRFA